MKKFLWPFLLIGGLLHAYRKNVLIENFTATWCSYCPYQATAISQLETVYGESLTVIKYHPSTSDPFYHSHSYSRLTYYGVPGYPTSLIQGNKAVVGGWNGVYSVLNNYVVQSFQGVSPCSLKVEILDFNPNTLVANARVKVFMTTNGSIPIPSQLKLRMVILEDSIFYNWQNMNILRYVVRGMWPNASGISLSLNHGDSAIYDFSFSIPSLLRAPYYYVAAFVQQDSIYQIIDYGNSYILNAGNVIQSGKGKLTVDFGYVTAICSGITDSNGNNRFERNESGTVNIALTSRAPFADAHDVILRVRSLNNYVDVIDTAFNFPIIPVNDTVYLPINIQVHNFDIPQMASLELYYSWDGLLSRVDTIRFKIGIDSVLVWDGSYDNVLKNYLKPFIDSLNFAYEWFSEADSGKPYLYEDYRTILYVSGQRFPDVSDANLFISAINSGKNLIISGQNIAESFNSVSPNFLSDYIGITLISNNTTDRKLIGTGNIFGHSDSALIGGSGSYPNQNSKDVIDIIAGSDVLPILYYRALTGSDVDSIAGILKLYPSGNRVIFLGFGVEGVGSSGTYLTKKNFLGKLFGVNIGIDEQIEPSFHETLVLKRGEELKLSKNVNKVFLYSADGRLIKEISASGGRITFSESKAGIYYLIYEDDRRLIRKRLLLLD